MTTSQVLYVQKMCHYFDNNLCTFNWNKNLTTTPSQNSSDLNLIIQWIITVEESMLNDATAGEAKDSFPTWRQITPQPQHNHFTALFSGTTRRAGARREPLDFMVQGKINRGRYTDHLAGRHSIRTNQCLPLPSPYFYRPGALPAAQPTVSKHWRQLVHSD